jgi:cobalamin biosynthesis Mg chelatase CobN
MANFFSSDMAQTALKMCQTTTSTLTMVFDTITALTDNDKTDIVNKLTTLFSDSISSFTIDAGVVATVPSSLPSPNAVALTSASSSSSNVSLQGTTQKLKVSAVGTPKSGTSAADAASKMKTKVSSTQLNQYSSTKNLVKSPLATQSAAALANVNAATPAISKTTKSASASVFTPVSVTLSVVCMAVALVYAGML